MRTRRQLQGLRAEWLLELEVSGQVFRFATLDVDVDTDDGETLRFREGLGPLVESVLTQGSTDYSIPIRLDVSESWDRLVSQFANIERSPCRVYRWFPGQTLEGCRKVLEGQLEGWTYGEVLEPVSFSIVRRVRTQSRQLPSAGMVVDGTTWPVRASWDRDQRITGAYYPIIIGAPGQPLDNTSTTGLATVEALLVETEGADNTDRLLIAGHEVEASTVTVWDYTDEGVPESASLTVEAVVDGVGRKVSIVEVGAAFTNVAEPGRVYYTGWHTASGSGGLRDPASAGVLRGAGRLLQWLIETWTDLPFDRRRFSSSLARLDQFKIDTYWNAPSDPLDLANELLEVLPAEVRQGPEGLWFYARPAEVTKARAVTTLSADDGTIQRESAISVESRQIVNEVTVEYAPDRGSGRYRRRVTVGPTAFAREDEFQDADTFDADDRVLGSYRAQLSRSRYGRQPTTVEAPHVHDRTTAVQIATEIIEEQALPKRFVEYTGGQEFEAYEPGTIVLLSDASVALDEELAILLDLEVGTPDVLLFFELVDDPVLLERYEDPPVVAPTDPTTTSPSDVADLYGWWDGFDSATYDGSSFLDGITDKGSNSLDMTVPSPGVAATSYDVNGVATDLPGPFPISTPQEHPETATGLAKSLGDFSAMLVIPIDSIRGTTSTLASLNLSGSPFYEVQIKQGTTTSEVDVQASAGVTAGIDVGFDNAAANGAHAIVFVRRSSSGNTVVLDSWYDKLLGAGIVKPTQVSAVDNIADPFTLDHVVFGGRGSITYTWQGTAPVHMLALWDRTLTDDEVLALAQWAGDRLGFSGIV